MTPWSTRVSAFVCLNLMASAAWSAETVNYSYDALGRLTTASIVDGPASGTQTSTTFDRAGNRLTYVVAGASSTDPTFSIGDVTVTEGEVATLVVTRSGMLTSVQSVDYETADGSATQPADYTAASGTLTFAAGEASKTIPVTTFGDSIYEPTETFSVNLSVPTNGAVIGDGLGAIALLEANTVPAFSITTAASVVEGAPVTLTVTRLGSTSSAVSVSCDTANGTAAAPSDFAAVSCVLHFAAGETNKTVTVPTAQDVLFEGPETFTLNLSSPSLGAVIANGTSTITITDDDVAPVFSISSPTVSESANSVTFTVTKAGTTTQAATVNYTTENGTATAGADYTTTSGTLSFAPADVSKTFTVPLLSDSIYEGTETFTANLSFPVNATISGTGGLGTATINDNDAAPTLSIAGTTVNEGGVATLTVTKSGATALSSSVNYTTANGTATAPDYYAAKSGTLTFAPSETTKSVTVTTAQNQYYDGSKTFSVGLSGAAGATISTSSATVNLNDDEAVPSILIRHATPSTGQVEEGNSQSYTIYTTGSPIRNPITITYSTANGTASSSSDYTAVSGSGSISSTISKQFSVQTTEDSAIEGNETFTVKVTRPASGFGSNFSYSPSNATVTTTIVNDDYTVLSPIANPDNAGSVPFCGVVTINPITNDTDPGGLYPLTLKSVTAPGFTQVQTGNTVELTKTAGGTAGTKTLTYIVKNTGGAEATGTITVNVTGPSCIN